MNLTLKDMLGICAFTVGPLGTLMLIMWRHFNSSIHNLRGELKGDIKELRGELKGDIKELRGELKGDIKELSGKIDAVCGRVSRIEGLLIFAKITPAEEIKANEVTDQKKEVTGQKEVSENTKGATVTYAQKLQQDGRLEGIHQIIKRMLHDNESIDKIIRWTGISKDAIKKLAF